MVFLVLACQPGDALPAGGHVSAIRQTEGRSFSDFSSADLRPRWGRSAGPHFSPMRNGGKNRLGRSPLRTSLGYWLERALPLSGPGRFRSHRWRRHSVGGAHSSVGCYFYRQGLTLVSRCSQRSGAWPPAAETPLCQGRPWQSKNAPSEKSMQPVERQAIYVTPPGPGPK